MTQNLMAEIAKKRIKKKEIAEALQIDERTLRNKLDGHTQFRANEMLKIKDTFFPEQSLDYLFAVERNPK